MRRAGVTALLAVMAAGLVALALMAASDKRDLAFTLGVVPSTLAAELGPGATVCQSPIAVPEAFAQVRFQVGTFRRHSGQPLIVAVRSAGSGRLLGRGRVPAGYRDLAQPVAGVGKVGAGRRIAVCVRNAGTRKVALYGNAEAAAQPSQAISRGRDLGTDLTLVFLAAERRSMLTLLPQVFERASVFRPEWVGAWVFWLLTAATLLGVPLLLARALADSAGAP